MSRFRAAVVICAVLIAATSGGAQDAKVIDLPVTRAVLYHSGVGYFEHAGTVDGDATLRLLFKEAQINDVLKSMVLSDADGGTISTVTYPSNEPLSRALASFSVDLSANPALHDLISQLRGSTVTVHAPEPITGKVLNVEKRDAVTGTPPAKTTDYILHLVTDQGIRSVNMSHIDALTLADPKLQDELNKALALLVQSRDQDTKPVEVRFVGKGKRQVRVGYLVETPVWKTSYRLDLSGEQPFIQGWAIVENTSDSDWKGVGLSLVSGQPISFVQDLYTPLYMPRPVVQPELYASLTPRRYDGGIDDRQMNERLSEAGRSEQLAARSDGLKRKAGAPASPAPAAAPMMLGRGLQVAGSMEKDRDNYAAFGTNLGVQSAASAQRLAELFKFTITSPVDLPRRRSSMLPIVNQPIKAEKVSIYNQQVMPRNPLNGVYLTNDTKMKLLGGPVTVFDAGAYAGDAQIGHLSQDDKRLLSYAVDLAVTVDPSAASKSAITAARIVKGVLQITQADEYTQTYKLSSKADSKRQVIIEHPFSPERKLIEPTTYEEKTPQLYRFRVALDAGKVGSFTVVEQHTHVEYLAILDYAADGLVYYSRHSGVDPKVRDALIQAIALKQQQTDLERQRQALQQQLNAIQSGQQRLRDNIKSVGPDSTLGKRYVAKLATEEDQIESLTTQIEKLNDQIKSKQKELSDYLAKLNVG